MDYGLKGKVALVTGTVSQTPGMVKTSFFAKWEEKPLDQLFAAVVSMATFWRNQPVDDIANALAFLASGVSKNITGEVLHVDSGTVML